MEEINSIDDAVSAFNQIDGIEANKPDYGRSLVKVNEESAVGDFFRLCREHDLGRVQTTRDDLCYTVLDSYVSLSDE